MTQQSSPAVAPNARAVVDLTWQQIEEIVDRITRAAVLDGAPQALVAVLRGGAPPAVMLSHRLHVRDVRAVEVTHTTDDSTHAAKTPEPVATNPASLGDLAGRDVLIVDDVAGTGHTLAAAQRLVAAAGARRVRTAACVVNADNWTAPRSAEAATRYVGQVLHGWVVFPWEVADEH
jgi:uncharacterized protein